MILTKKDKSGIGYVLKLEDKKRLWKNYHIKQKSQLLSF